MRTNRALLRQIVTTYANALYEAAAAEGAVDRVGTELDAVLFAIHGHAELRAAMVNEELPAKGRMDVLTSVFTDLHPVTAAGLTVMVDEGNFDALSAIAEEYANTAESRRDMAVAEVTTAVPLTEPLRKSISEKLATDLGKEVVLREKVDPSIIGGIVIDAAGRRIDASIVSQLDHARAVLSTTASHGGDV